MEKILISQSPSNLELKKNQSRSRLKRISHNSLSLSKLKPFPQVSEELKHKPNQSMKLIGKSSKPSSPAVSKSFSIKLPSLEKNFSMIKQKNLKKKPLIKNMQTKIGEVAVNKTIDFRKKLSRIEYSTVSRVGSIDGKPKTFNQDSFFAIKNAFGYKNLHIFTVFDGHGPEGHVVSKYLESQFPGIIKQYSSTITTNPLEDMYKEVFLQAVSNLDSDLKSSYIDIAFSGSTLLSVLLTETDCCCVSVGDSRALIGSFDRSWSGRALNKEHKPSDFLEKKRIEESGGRVGCLKDCSGKPVGPVRAWGCSLNSPGLAMSRTLGDSFAEGFGVISVPDVKVNPLKPSDRFVVVATDGLWDSVSNNKVVEIVSKFWETGDFANAADALANYATASSLKTGGYVDDITIIVVFRTN